MGFKKITKLVNEIIKQRDEYKKDRDKYKKALEDIIDSEECKVCKCQQVMGHTYDGLSFVILQKMAKRALK